MIQNYVTAYRKEHRNKYILNEVLTYLQPSFYENKNAESTYCSFLWV